MLVKIILFASLFIVYIHTQFHQDTYHIIHDRIEIADYNRTRIFHPKFSLDYVNSTRTQLLGGSAYFAHGVTKNILINVAVLRFVSRKYRPFPINLTLDLCEEYNKAVFGIDLAVKQSNFRGCPAEKGDYWIYNASLEEDRFPPRIPFGKYKLDIRVRADDSIYLGLGYWYGSIVSKSKWLEESRS